MGLGRIEIRTDGDGTPDGNARAAQESIEQAVAALASLASTARDKAVQARTTCDRAGCGFPVFYVVCEPMPDAESAETFARLMQVAQRLAVETVMQLWARRTGGTYRMRGESNDGEGGAA